MQELIREASKYLGVCETPGKDSNPIIMSMFESAGHTWVNSEETPWCSAFICHVAEGCGYMHPESLLARSWSSDQFVDPGGVESIASSRDLKYGDIVVLWRRSRHGTLGHVGLFMNQDDRYIYLLGGNQSNKVCVKPYYRYRFLSGVRYV